MTVNVTDGSLTGIASAINAANAGVSASVIQDAAGELQLQLTGKDGATNGFVVTGTDTGGTGTQSLASLDYSASNATQDNTDYTTTSAATDQTTGNPAVNGGIPIYDPSGNAQNSGAGLHQDRSRHLDRGLQHRSQCRHHRLADQHLDHADSPDFRRRR